MVKNLLNPTNIRINYVKVVKKSNFRVQFEFDSVDQRNSVKSLVSYQIPGAKYSSAVKSGRWDGTKTFLTETNTLPVGIFKSLFPKHEFVYNKAHTQLSYDDIPLYRNKPNLDRRQYQLDAINTIFQHKYGLINCVMGSGKTAIAAATCTYHLKQNPKNKILFIVYDVNILTQTIRTFTSYGLKVTQFGNSIKDLSGDVIVATIQSLNNVKEPSKSLKDITFVFLDEAHHGKSKTSKSIISKIPNAEYRIGLTATPHKENTLDLAELLAVTGPIIYEYGFTEAIQDNKIAPVKAFFLDVDPDWDIKEQVITRKNYKVIWDAAIQTNKTRNQLISNALHYLVELLDTTNLVLVDRTEHGTALCASMRSRSTIRATTMYGSDDIVMREIKKTHLQKEGDDTINTIVSTVVKEGVDFSVSPVIAVNASGRKSFINLIQFLGRITRANEKFGTWRQYIDFIDNYHPLLRQHSYDRINACKQFGIDVIIVHSLKELLDETVKYYKECKVRDGNL